MADGYDLAYANVGELPVITPDGTDYVPVFDTSARRWGKVLASADIAGVTATAAEINNVADVSVNLVAGGSALTVTQALHAGKLILLNTSTGTTATLPDATGSGSRYRFAVSVTATSNSHIIKTARAADHMTGFINVCDQDGTTAALYKGNGTDDDTITMNRTTTGGIIGDYVEIIDYKANLYLVTVGTLTCVAGSNVADPFSATVS